MKKWLFVMWMMFFAIGCCGGHLPRQIVPRKLSEAEFINAFLHIHFADAVSEGFPLVINEQLSIEMLFSSGNISDFTADLIKEAKKQEHKLAEAVQDFCTKNSSEKNIKSLGKISIEHIVLMEHQLKDLFDAKKEQGKDGWQVFYDTYPDSPGIITLSLPGFSADGTIGVIYMGNQRGWLVGHGRLYVLEKIGERWVKTDWLIGPSWVS